MTDSPTEVALRYVGQAVETLRTTVHDEFAAVRTDLNSLGGELRHHVATQSARLAVLEHQAAEAKEGLAAVQAERATERAERERERAADRRLRIQIVCTAAVSVLCALLALLNQLLGGG